LEEKAKSPLKRDKKLSPTKERHSQRTKITDDQNAAKKAGRVKKSRSAAGIQKQKSSPKTKVSLEEDKKKTRYLEVSPNREKNRPGQQRKTGRSSSFYEIKSAKKREGEKLDSIKRKHVWKIREKESLARRPFIDSTSEEAAPAGDRTFRGKRKSAWASHGRRGKKTGTVLEKRRGRGEVSA